MTVNLSKYFMEMKRLYSSRVAVAIFFGIGGVLTALLGATQLLDQEEPVPSAQAQSIRILDVAAVPLELQDSYHRTRSYLGKVDSQRTSRLGFEVAGMLDAIYVREGESIAKNQLLAELDTDRLEASRKEAEAQLLEAQAALKLAEATLKRTQQAKKLKAVSDQQLDEATSNLERQRALVVRVKAQLGRIDVDLKKSKLYAPYAGTLALRMSDEGTVLSPGQPVFEITETARTEIRIGFDRDLSATLKPGAMIDASIRGLSLPLRIERILPGRAEITRVVQFIATPVRADVPLREGDLVEVTLKQRIFQAGVWLPVSALTENARGLWSCLVAEPIGDANEHDSATHRLKRKDLHVVSLEGERVYVSGQFQPGDHVVMDGVHRVVPNQRVRLANGALAANMAVAADREGGI